MINISIDLTKIDKGRIVNGKNGQKYYSLTVDTKKEPDQFGNTHTAYQTPTKEERTAKAAKVYVGSGREFVFDGGNKQPNRPAPQQNNQPSYSASPEKIDDLPF